MIDSITTPARIERKNWLENTTPTMRRLGLLFSGIAVWSTLFASSARNTVTAGIRRLLVCRRAGCCGY
jgi:hypothetical protein